MADKTREPIASHSSSQTNETVPILSPAPRERLVSSAVKFFKSPNTATVSQEYKENFLMSKGSFLVKCGNSIYI